MERKVSFYSDGLKIAGVLYEPDNAGGKSCPGIVMVQGMLGIKEQFWFPHVASRFAALGYVALIWDYRGAGESEGEHGRLFPLELAEDIRNALTYLETQPKVDPERLALAGWSFGGGMAPYVAGIDERVKCAISVIGWGDGERWMRSVRRYSEWLEFRDRVAEDRKSRVLTGKSGLLELGEILVRDPSSKDGAVRERILGKIPNMQGFKPTPVSLASADKILEFRPIDVVDLISPRAMLYIVAENDVVTPADDVIDMYEITEEPKKLWVIPGLPHNGVYEEPYLGQVIEMTTDWLREHLQPV